MSLSFLLLRTDQKGNFFCRIDGRFPQKKKTNNNNNNTWLFVCKKKSLNRLPAVYFSVMTFCFSGFENYSCVYLVKLEYTSLLHFLVDKQSPIDNEWSDLSKRHSTEIHEWFVFFMFFAHQRVVP